MQKYFNPAHLTKDGESVVDSYNKEVPSFSEFIDIETDDVFRKAGDSYEALSPPAKNIIDRAVFRYMEWLSKIHHGIIPNPKAKK